MTDRAATTTRRTTLGVALGTLVVLPGCDAVSDLSPSSDTPPLASPSLPPADADTALVDRVVLDLEETIAAIPRARGLKDQIADLRDMHAAHRAELTDDDRFSFATSGTPLPRSEALRRITRLERAHQRRLEVAAIEARSGSLAVVLAQMSAAVAQRLALLPSGTDGGAA